MKLSIEQVNELALLQSKVAEAYKNYDLSTFSKKGVFMTPGTLIDTFETFVVRDRNKGEFPCELSVVAGGTLFYAFMSTSEIADLESTHPEKFEYISRAFQKKLA